MGSKTSQMQHPSWYDDEPSRTIDLYSEYLETNLAVCMKDEKHKAKLRKVLTGLNFNDMVELVNKRLEIEDLLGCYSYCTPLAFAIAMNDLELVSMLINNGADLSCKPCFLQTKNEENSTSEIRFDPVSHVHFACIVNCDENIMQFLMSSEAQMENVPEKDYSPVLKYASKCKDLKMIHFLIGDAIVGPFINRSSEILCITDANGESALHYAVKNHNRILAEILLENDFVADIRDNQHVTPLMLAVERNNLKFSTVLIEFGADVLAVDDLGRGMLQYALKHNSTSSKGGQMKMELIHMLRESLPWPTMTEQSLADCAVFVMEYFTTEEILGLLQVNTENLNGQSTEEQSTILKAAITSNQQEIVSFLMTHNVSLNAIDKKGWSALMYAVATGVKDAVQKLLYAGADIDYTSPNGWTPLWLALRHGWQEITCLLVREGANINQAIQKNVLPMEHSHIILPAVMGRGTNIEITTLEYALYMNYFTVSMLLGLAGFNIYQSIDSDANIPMCISIINDKTITYCIKSDKLSKNIISTLRSLQKMLQKPKTLEEHNRIVVRKALAKPVLKSIKALPLPESVQNFLSLTDVNELRPC